MQLGNSLVNLENEVGVSHMTVNVDLKIECYMEKRILDNLLVR